MKKMEVGKATSQWELALEYLLDRGFTDYFENENPPESEKELTKWIAGELEGVNDWLSGMTSEINSEPLMLANLKEAFDRGYDLGVAQTILNGGQ